MRILDDKTDIALNTVSIFLTKEEAQYLISCLKNLVSNKTTDHSHLTSEDETKEITVCIYNSNDINKFNSRVQKLIKDDI